MTNIYHRLPIVDIKIGPRFRVIDPNDRAFANKFRDLKESIKAHGLFHAVVLDRDYNLLAGYCRILASRELGYDNIYCRFIDEVDELTRREIELEENYARSNLTWQDEDRLIKEVDRLKRAKYGSANTRASGDYLATGWDSRDTAQSLGIDESTVNRSIARVEAMQYVPSMADSPTRKAADRELDRFIQELETELNLRKRNIEAQNVNESLFLGDCINHMSAMRAGSVDLIITDPPYGIDIASSTASSDHRRPAEYNDDPISITAILRNAFLGMRRVLKHNGHAYIFCSSSSLDQIRFVNLLSESGFDVEPIPLIWVKDSHTTVDWDYRYAPSYESILFCSNRQRRLDHKRSNIFSFDNDLDRIHTAQKPVALLSEFLAQSSSPGEVVLDPFMGSGSTIIAAIRSSRRYIGMELNQSTFAGAKQRIMNELELKRQKEEVECPTDENVESI